MWSTEKTLQLIELVHSSPALWDANCGDYKNKVKKVDAMRKIADKLSVDVSEVEKKIKTLKVQLRREHLKLTSMKKSGVSPKKCAWFGYEPLLFMLHGQECTGSQSTDSTEREVAEDGFEQETERELAEVCFKEETDAVIESPHLHQEEPPPHIASQICFSSSNKRTGDKLDEAFHLIKAIAECATERDEYHVFGENVAHKLRNCGRSKREVSFAQHKINEIIFNLEMGHFRESVTEYPQHSSNSENNYSGLSLAASQGILQYLSTPRNTTTPSCSRSQSACSNHSEQ